MSLPISTYLKILNPYPPENNLEDYYEVLDNNTILYKQNKSKSSNFQMYQFDYIFPPTINNLKLTQSLPIAHDLFEGLNQIIMIQGCSSLKDSLLIGDFVEDSGIIIQIFNQILQESKQPYQINPKIYVSFYSTEKQRNSYIDLLLGQRYQHFTRKTFDNYHIFYYRLIQSLRQFLIALKIATTRFSQCCSDADSFVFKIGVESYDEFQETTKFSELFVIYSDTSGKTFQSFCKRNINFKSEDGGDLINHLQPAIRVSKNIILYTMLNRKTHLLNSLEIFSYLDSIHQISITKSTSNHQTLIPSFNFPNPTLIHPQKNVVFLSNKQMTQLKMIKQKYYALVNQNNSKLKNYIDIMEKDYLAKEEAYLKVRFPISLEIKQDNNVKSYFIAKIYGLSVNYKIQDMNSNYDKLNIIKNQILISMKAFSKQFRNISLQPQTQKILNQLIENINQSKQILKTLFSINTNIIKIRNISLENLKKLKIFNLNIFENTTFNSYSSKQNSLKQLSNTFQYSIRKFFDGNKKAPSIYQITQSYMKIKAKLKNNQNNISLPKIFAIKKI